ncbi:MAG: GH25 family lysozyme [Oscillospiraceae bacterium]
MEVKYKMIDVSHHNGEIDFAKVKADGVQGVIIRAGFGFRTLDSCFLENIKNALAVGLHIGIYWFGYASTVAQAKQEAEFLAKTLDTYRGKIDLPIFYDWEYDSYNYIKKTYGITATKQLVSDMTQAFCEVLEKYGYFSGFYANIDYLDNFYTQSVKDRFCCWVAQWSSKCTYSGQYGIWQYGASTNKIDNPQVDGISSKYVDKSYCYIDYPSIIKSGKFNGYGKTNETIVYNYDVNGDGVVNEKDLKTLEDYLKEIGEIDDNSTSTTENYSVWQGVKTFSYSKDKDIFLSPHFQVKEFASIDGNGKLYSDNVLISYDLVKMLEKLYEKLNCTSITINSGYRTSQHDKAVGGSGTGQHVLGKAADIVCRNSSGIIPAQVVCCVASEDIGFGGVANISSRYQAVHVDVRTGSQYRGDEIRGNSSIWNYNPSWTDFYVYFGLSQADVEKYTS